MAIKTEKELSEIQRGHWLKAMAAIELRNFGYAISLLQGILRQEPEFLTGRRLLRRTEVTKNKSAKKSLFNISTAPIAVMKAQREIKKDPKRAVEMIEKILEEEPYHRQANLVLKEAESYRDLIKDKDVAISLEQQSRMQLTGESLDKQIAEIYALHQAQPENIDLARRLGALNEQKSDIEAATAWYQYAADLSKGSD